MVLMKILVIALLASVAFITGQTTRPCDLKIGSIGGSPGGQYQLAQKLGWVLPAEFNLCVSNVPGSLELYDAMRVGTYDLTVAQLDNALSRYVNGILPLVVLGGDSRGGGQGIVGNLNNGIHAVADLRGKNIGVDAVESGLVYGLRKVLAVHGLLYPRDYSFVVCGGTPQRTTCTQQGFVMINGQKVLVHASSLPTSAADPAKNTTMLAYVPDYIAPLQSTAVQVVQSTLSDATKVSALTTYMYHLIRAQKFYANPANKDYIIKEFLAKGVTTAAALATARASYDAFMNIQDGSVTATNDWTFQRVPVLNVIYVRKEFNGFTVPNADQIDFNDLITPRPGGFIDYSIRDAANALVAQNVTVTVNHQVTDSGICWNYAGGQTVTVPNFLAGLRNNGVSGGCLGTPVLTVRSITTTDNNAHISDFSYNAASDTLTFVADTSFNSNGITSRQVNVVVDVSEPCTPGVLDSITQVYTFYNKNSGPASCVSLVPPCVVQVTHTLTNSWTGQGVSHAQYNLHISNPSSIQKVTSVQFQLSAEDAANLENVWNLQVVDAANRIYTLPNWQVAIAASSSYEQAGYISKVAPLTWKVINPVCQQL